MEPPLACSGTDAESDDVEASVGAECALTVESHEQRRDTIQESSLRGERLAAAYWTPIASLRKWRKNPRKNDRAVPQVARSIRKYGFVSPVVVWQSHDRIVAGHTRVLAMESILASEPGFVPRDAPGIGLVPVRFHEFTDEAEANAYALADNRLNETAEWDQALLAEVMKELHTADEALLAETGFSDRELKDLLDDSASGSGGAGGEGADQVDRAHELQKKWRTESGQLWLIPSNRTEGKAHRLLCGDSTRNDVVGRVMEGARATWCWTDPPWNVAYGASDHPTWKSREILNDNLGDKFPAFCQAFIEQIKASVLPGAMLYMAMSAQEWPVIDGALRAAGFHWSSTIIWKKDRLVLSRKDYHTQFEPIWYGWEGSAPRLRPLEDRTQSDVWEIDRPSRSDEHPTMKPIELVARALTNSTRPGDLGFEPFSGSGTTLLAAEQTGRLCHAMELDRKYVAVALERLALTGLRPRLG